MMLPIKPKYCVLAAMLCVQTLLCQQSLAQRPILSHFDSIEWGGWLAWGTYFNSHGLDTQTGSTLR